MLTTGGGENAYHSKTVYALSTCPKEKAAADSVLEHKRKKGDDGACNFVLHTSESTTRTALVIKVECKLPNNLFIFFVLLKLVSPSLFASN